VRSLHSGGDKAKGEVTRPQFIAVRPFRLYATTYFQESLVYLSYCNNLSSSHIVLSSKSHDVYEFISNKILLYMFFC
jgi:hypothetical protein